MMKSMKLTLLAAIATIGMSAAQAKDEMYIPVVK